MPYLHSPNEKMRTLDPVVLRSVHPLSDGRKREIIDSYTAEVDYTDRQVLRLLDHLDQVGVLDRGVVVLTADHGEEFWDHGGVEHGHSHHGEVVDVPLLLVAPGVFAGPGSGVASISDVVPTILAILGAPSEGLDLRRHPPADRIATAWGGLIQRLDCSARGSNARLIAQDCSDEGSSMRLFDLGTDLAERFPLRAEGEHPLVRAIQEIAPPLRREPMSVSSGRLRGLGYLH